VSAAAADLRSQLLGMASEVLDDVPVSDLEIAGGKVSIKGVPSSSILLKDLVRGREGGVPPRTLIGKGTAEPGTDYSFAADFTEVEVDTETGRIDVIHVVAVH
jgi:xanthine dehydrogenase molybdenum-binding subunit